VVQALSSVAGTSSLNPSYDDYDPEVLEVPGASLRSSMTFPKRILPGDQPLDILAVVSHPPVDLPVMTKLLPSLRPAPLGLA
jgi:N-acetyl-gamma-glutamyl-phosphate reductase / acetylglutamate kinase